MKPFPLIEYAQSIGKNTAEFNLKDFAGYMKWWLKQKPREDILKMGANYKQDLAAMQKFRAEATVGKVDPSQMEDGEAQEISEVVMEEETEVMCSMELTKQDVEALLFSIERTFSDYNMEAEHPHTISLAGLKKGLEGVYYE
jgi:hypothetical protein